VACNPQAYMKNPYEGLNHARQLSETVEAFLKRLPPSTTEKSTETPWIRIANPYADHEKNEKSIEDEISGEGPPSLGTNTQDFIKKGTSILQELEAAIQEIEKNTTGQPASALSDALSKQREKSVEKIKNAAKEYGIILGKV
jgi:Domain of unknown function (DUF1917)